MPLTLTRREFLQALAALGASAYTLGALGGRAQTAPAAPPAARAGAVAAAQFAPLPSKLATLLPMTDVGAGWDGSLWAIDSLGAPHLYDPLGQQWDVFGPTYDAVCIDPAGQTLAFLGAQVAIGGAAPVSLAAQYPNVPAAFQNGVDGAAAANGVLYLFRSGRCVPADGGVPLTLTSLAAWPQTANWASGVVDAVGSNYLNPQDPQVLLLRGAEYLLLDLSRQAVVAGPQPLSALFSGALLTLLEEGVDAIQYQSASDPSTYQVLQGPIFYMPGAAGALLSSYADLYAGWSPRLAAPPSGQLGKLWGLATGALYLLALTVNPTALTAAALNLADGALLWSQSAGQVNTDGFFYLTPPVLGQCAFGGAAESALVVNANDHIWALRLADQGATTLTYAGPGGGSTFFSSALAYRSGVYFVAARGGLIYALGADLQPAEGTPTAPQPGTDIVSDLLPLADSAGNLSLAFGLYGQDALAVFDLAAQELLTLDTNQTVPNVLTLDAVHGVVYATGAGTQAYSSLGQLFAISAGAALQADRAFIVDSQLMQDYDELTAGTVTAAARYQTHVTVVDANNTPVANTAIKLWAQSALTLQIDGTAYAVDADTPAFFQADGTGSFTIVSDADDLSAVVLLLWAGFMDPSERIVIFPDREFHGRLSTTTADPANPDPTNINLATATSYDGALLCADSSQATTAAATVQKWVAAVDVTQSSSSSTAVQRTAASRRGHAALRSARAAAATPKYLAEPNLVGAAYAPFTSPVIRTPAIVAPLGFVFDGALTILSVADAAAAIDALAGEEGLLRTSAVGSIFKSLWDDIKHGVAAVKQVVVSVGRSIYAGFQYVANGVIQVARVVLETVEDVVATIGAFFVQLGKDFLAVVEALSLLFNFGEIVKTQGMLRDLFTAMVSSLQQDAQDGFKALDTWISQVRLNADQLFDGLIAQFGSSSRSQASHHTAAGGTLYGTTGGATPRSVLTVNAGGASHSVAVQGMWGIHKTRQNASSVSSSSSLAAALGMGAADPVGSALSGFLQNNPALAQDLGALRDAFRGGLSLSSPQAIFDMVVADLLLLAKAAVVGGIDIVQGLASALAAVVDDLVALVGDGGALHIPVISTLFQSLTGSPLTVLDLLALVAAIPVTLIYRIVAGAWPSQDVPAGGAAALSSAPLALVRVQGIANAMFDIITGVFTAIYDTIYVSTGGQVLVNFGKWPLISAYCSMALLATGSIYNVALNVTSSDYWTVVALTLVSFAVNLYSSVNEDFEGGPILSAVGWLLAIGILLAQYEGDAASAAELEIVGDAIGNLPGVIGIVKLIADPAAIIPYAAPVADLGCMVAAGGIGLAATIRSWSAAPDPGPTSRYHYHLPWISRDGQ